VDFAYHPSCGPNLHFSRRVDLAVYASRHGDLSTGYPRGDARALVNQDASLTFYLALNRPEDTQ
jgi:hypothetical protein